MEFIVFLWLTAALFLLFHGGFLPLLGLLPWLRTGRGYRVGLLLLAGVLCFYAPACEGLWRAWGQAIHPRLESPLLRETWYIAVFFRSVWPALGAALLGLAADAASHPRSGAYRSMKGFHHSKVFFLLLVLGLLGLSLRFGMAGGARIFLLNGAVYTAAWYWRFGYHTVVYTLKRCRVPYAAAVPALLFATIGAGSAFLLPLAMVLGIGVSDIWMDYHRRGAAGLLFGLQLK